MTTTIPPGDRHHDEASARPQGDARSSAGRRTVGRTLRSAWDRGDKSLQYTAIAIVSILVLGAIMLPLTIPEAPAVQDRSEVLAERYLATLPKDAKKPAIEKVQAMYGTDGGKVCSSSSAAVYQSMLTTTKGSDGKKRSSLNRTKMADTRRAMDTYCPAQSTKLKSFVNKRSAAMKRKRAAALRAAGG